MNAGTFRRSMPGHRRLGLLLLGLTLMGPQALMARASSSLPETARLEQSSPWDQLPANASPSQQLQVADQTSRLISGRVGELRKRIEEARQAQDIVLLSCLNETLSGAAPWIALADTALVLARRAMGPDPRQAAYELKRVATGQITAMKKLEAADRCDSSPDDGSNYEYPIKITGGLEPGDNHLGDPPGPYHPDPSEPPPVSP